MGEIAKMAIGEGWCKACKVDVVRCKNYTHQTRYTLPIAPSPNLRSMQAVYLYPSTCLFEGTICSLGRGTEHPFELYGHPSFKSNFSFTPRSIAPAIERGVNEKFQEQLLVHASFNCARN